MLTRFVSAVARERPFLASLIPLLFAVAAQAQSVRWEPSDSGMANSVQLVFENCAPDGEPQLPVVAGVTFTRIAESTNTNIVNFQVTRSVILTYQLRGRQTGPVAIPAFSVKTDKGSLRVAAFNTAAPAPPLESVAGAKLTPERASVWAGEVFTLNYELSAARRTNPQISPTFDWTAAPLVAEDWSKPEVTEAVVNGDRRVNVLFRTRAVGKTPNRLKLEAANHLLSIQTGTIGFGIISQPRMEQVSVTSDQPVLEIRPLPAAPLGFSGAVGQFKLVSKVVPEKAAVGEPVTWTLELSGTGNWPDLPGLPARDVSSDFQVVQPKAKRTPAEGKLFDVTLAEDVVLVPTKAGTYALGPVNFTYFDPKSGSYKTITAPRTAVTISAPIAPQFNVSAPPATTGEKPDGDVSKAGAAGRPPSAPTPPAPIPRDPLPGAAVARAPLVASTLITLLAAPFALLLLFWGWLAVRRAQHTDPVRPRREARDRLARVIAELQSQPSSGPGTTARLLAWQRDAAVLWQLPDAAPRATALTDAAWARLWTEADRALYSAQGALPPDWVTRAQAALAAKRVPGFQPLRLFLPQNLMPFAALIAVLLVATATVVTAAELDALAAYRKADFANAEKGWRAALGQQPTNWIARHNLSLALAQQERATEAAAHATAAFVQHPGDPSVRWHFALAAEKAGAAPAILTRFITPGPWQTLGRFASPADWQLGLILASWVTAAALGWLLANTYGRKARGRRWTALALIAAGVLLGGSAAAGVQSYGLAAHADAVIVARPSTLRSIPTEADAAQKTSPLAAGTLALADRAFLSWTRLTFENGQTGWIRNDDLVRLWK
ncbi:BatD family protein [Horticoccus sp. 23ND18S-11]|uniref:BatD family protein n=1 Tax=Horticoccus sp. 23ND18S-11 TaxID=3391832 RepID=UPI0039C96BF4